MNRPFDIIAEAYDRNAPAYDSFIEGNPNLNRMRQIVYDHITRNLPRGSRILDLACGTGTDALWLAQNGYYVHGLDISGAMLERAEQKRKEYSLQDLLKFEQRSYTDLGMLNSEPFDCTISNFGGLNCVSDLSAVATQVQALLRAGGWVIWSLMPSFCLWESAMIFKGRLRLATRRFTGKSTIHKEGLSYPVFYYSPKQVIAAFGRNFRFISVRGLSVFTPPATNKDFAIKRPGIFRVLTWIDDRLSLLWPFKNWGDFSIVTLRQNSSQP